MHLLAQASSGSSPVYTIIVVVFMLIGLRKICTVLGSNKTARDATKQGGLFILRHLFKK